MSAAGNEAPVVAGSLFGLRLWSIASAHGQFRLASATAIHNWNSSSPQAAKCRKGQHPVPASECSCGYYCFHQSRDPMLKLMMFTRRSPRVVVAGIVRVWGRTEVHATGMRSEFAEPDALFMPEAASPAYQAVIQELAMKYGAAVWAGSSEQLLARMAEKKPGLSPTVIEDLVGTSSASPEELDWPSHAPRMKKYPLLPLGPERRKSATDKGCGHPLVPWGYWPSNSEPRLGLLLNRTGVGQQIVRLSGTRRSHRRLSPAETTPGTIVELSPGRTRDSGPGTIQVKSQRGITVGVIPERVARSLLSADPSLMHTRAWILCNWRNPESKPGSPPERINILLAEPGAAPPRFPGPHSDG